MAKIKTQTYRYDVDAWSATTYDAPIGYVEPGDTRDFVADPPDGHWSLVVDVPAPASKPVPAPAPAVTEPATEVATTEDVPVDTDTTDTTQKGDA